MLTNKNRAAQAISTFWTTLLLLFFTGCQPSGPKSLLLGDKYVRQGDYQKALKYLARAAVAMPERPEVWNFQGLAYHGAQQPARAAEAYQRALRINRNFAPAHFNLGVLLLEQERPVDAATELSAYVALQPNDDQGWSRLGDALVRIRKTEEADRALNQALKLNPKNADAHNSMGLVHIQRKRPLDAVRSFNTALQYRPGFGAALLNQAIVAQQHFGNSQIALERYRAFLNTKPDARMGSAVQLAIRQIEQAANPTPPQVPLADLTTNTGISALLRSNLAAQAERSRAQATSAIPTNPPALATTATNVPARPIQEPISPLKTNQPGPVAAASVPKTNAPSLVSTQQVAQLTVTNHPTVTSPVPAKTNALPTEEETDTTPMKVEVVEVNKEPDFQAPKDVEVVSSNATARAEDRPLIAPRKKSEEEKRGLLARLKSPGKWFEHEEPRSTPVPIPPARSPVIPEAAEQTARVAPPVQPQPRPVIRYEYRKDLNLSKGNRAQAQRLFTQGAGAHQQGRLLDAISYYRQSISADPSYFEAHYNLGLAAYQAKELSLALAANEQAVALRPNSTDARYNFALTLREGHYYTDAASELRELLNEAPNETRAHLALANLYALQLDEPALARTHYQRFLELAPNHPEAPVVRDWLMMHR